MSNYRNIYRDDITHTHTHTHTHTLTLAGSETWPAGAYVSQWSGHTLGASSTVTLLPCLRPGEEADVSVSLVSPLTSGCFQSQWKMFTSRGTMCGGESLSLPSFFSLPLSPSLSLSLPHSLTRFHICVVCYNICWPSPKAFLWIVWIHFLLSTPSPPVCGHDENHYCLLCTIKPRVVKLLVILMFTYILTEDFVVQQMGRGVLN